MTPNQVNLLGMDRQLMAGFFSDLGEKPFRADQVTKWIHQQGATSFEMMTNISRDLRKRLSTLSVVDIPGIENARCSADGTRKWLLRLEDGNCIETVFIPEAARGTLCVSSQVGCALNCTFCATARQGYNRNLTSSEIVGQLWLANRALGSQGADPHGPPGVGITNADITNVVLMGMGEPLLNLDQVLVALRLMLDDFAYGLSRRRVTLSTAGIVPGIDRLRVECPVSLAVSLHAPNDELRDRLVPVNKKYPIRILMEACRRYVADAPRTRITFEYVMLAGVNDSPQHARELIALLQSLPAKINLIPFNGFAGAGYKCSVPRDIARFQELLIGAGMMTMVRKTRGDDIDAACGQLAGQFIDRTNRSRKMRAQPRG
jgi:23S rRNA (adenine2503-C2)-methyltransferase